MNVLYNIKKEKEGHQLQVLQKTDINETVYQMYSLENQIKDLDRIRLILKSLITNADTEVFQQHLNSYVHIDINGCKDKLLEIEAQLNTLRSKYNEIYNECPLVNSFQYVIYECCRKANISFEQLNQELKCEPDQIRNYLKRGVLTINLFNQLLSYFNLPKREVYLRHL